MIGIYKITSPSNKIYIGQSKNIPYRISTYKRLDCKNQPRLYKSFLKYGYENHIVEIIEECIIEQLNERERYWQEFYDVLAKNGLNCMYVKTDIKKAKLSLERIEKLRISSAGNKNMLGKHHSEETKKILSIKSRLHRHTNDAKERIIKSLTGRPVSDETRLKISNSNMNRKATDETKKNISKALTGRKLSKECLIKRSITMNSKPSPIGKLVIHLETGIFYDSIKEASDAYGINKSTIHNGFKRNKKKAKIIYA